MRAVAVSLIVLSLTACTVTKNVAIQMPPAANVSIYDGKVVSETFINKVGKENPKIIDLYFETGGKRYFIKFLDGSVSRNEMVQYLGKNVRIQGNVKYGLWDTDNPNDQSRVGNYVVIQKIVE
ncbi:MAG: hypothetical protein LLG40_07360 [Deltaproteobacteria bacterium]|nr:hypothetical protein [Deltaproteobacteria bacterium]